MENIALELPFDQYERYRVGAELVGMIKKAKGAGKLKVLDVGGCTKNRDGHGYFLPVTLFLPDEEVMVVDRVPHSDPRYVRGDGLALSFPEGEFDVVLSNDVLEHIPFSGREDLLKNLVRVSGGFIVLATPYKTEANETAEKLLFEFILKRIGIVHPLLNEHIVFGLPDKNEIEEILKRLKFSFISFHGCNTFLWFIMMILKHYLLSIFGTDEIHRKIDRFYNENFWRNIDPSTAYRSFYLISKAGPVPQGIADDIRSFVSAGEALALKPEPIDPESFFKGVLEIMDRFPLETGLGVKILTSLRRLILSQR